MLQFRFSDIGKRVFLTQEEAEVVYGRMVEKGYLSSERRGRCAIYKMTISPEEHRRQELQNVIDLFYSGDVRQARENL